MNPLIGGLEDWIKQGLIEGIMGQFTSLYDSVNAQVGDIATNVGRTPSDWNPAIFSMVRTLSDTAIVPIAGMILTFVLCYELIQMIIDKNNMHDFHIVELYKWVFKTFAAVWILTHTFDLVMAVFALAQNVVNTSAGLISGSLDVGAGAALADLELMLQGMGVWELVGLWLESSILGILLTIMTIFIFVVIYGRMIEIYLTVSVAPIPFATMANREWGQIGNNYLKSLFAIAFQGFLIIVCVAIYAVLIRTIPSAGNVHGAIWGTAAYTALLSMCLLKSGSLSKQIFSAH